MAVDKDSEPPIPTKTVRQVLAEDQANRELMALMQSQQAELNSRHVAAARTDPAAGSNALNQDNTPAPTQAPVPITAKKE